SFQRNNKFFANHQDQIYIISSGFKEYIIPVVSTLGVLPEHVLANEFRFDEDGNIIGIDESNPLASDGGKIKALQSLGLDAEVYVIGDGYTDYESKESGLASRFYAFTENVKRDRVLAVRSEEHTSELQSRENLVCRLLLEKKKTDKQT